MIGVMEGFELAAGAGPLMMKDATVQGIRVGHRRALEDVVRHVKAAGLRPVIDARYGLDELSAALDHLDRGAFGKIVIDMH